MNIDPVTFAKALADETRQEIMTNLCCVWLSVNDVVDKLDGKVNQPTVSFHLKKLEEANLVTVRQEGRQRFYTLNQEQLNVCCGKLVWSFAPDYRNYFNVIPIDTIDEISEIPTFIEGVKVPTSHFRIERNATLRKLFLSTLPLPIRCDICQIDTSETYPWVENLVEVHHLLPLSSDAAIEKQYTALTDLVALCPNCHKAVHIYYAQWLAANSQDDFNNPAESHNVYQEAKSLIQPR